MSGINIIRRWVMGQMTKKADDGIMITLPDMKKVELNTNITAERLMRNGVDPNSITNVDQVDNMINQLNSPMTMNRPGKKGIMKTKSADIFEIATGKEIPKGSKIMGGQAMETEAEIAERLSKQNKDAVKKLKDKMNEPEEKADGGRIGYKKGSVDLARRGFMKAAAGVGAGIGALKMGALKLFGKQGAREVTKNVIKTDAIPGKPEWFDSLVTKVINEGTDVTKKFATQEREIVHATKIGDDEMVTVYRNMDNGEIRVEYASPENMGGDTIDLVYKKPLPDEANPKPTAEFYAIEPEPRGIRTGPDDYDIEFDGENFANNVDELMSDTTKLKIFAKGDAKPTLKEFVKSKKKKDKTKAINENTVEQAEYLETKYGPGPEDVEDFARGGIARMLGE